MSKYINIDTPDGSFSAYLAKPSTLPAPGIVVVQEIFGRFAYESQDQSGQWRRSYGNENWEFDETGLMRQRHASINDLPILESERLFRWPLGRRPDDHPGLSDLGL